ncbi:putative RDD family membrane protein YckC [Lapillicoccus jejuensis]|uniref:Putative RDD family membrane protein YckC n=1 Tax=Lapillicoccus jejuensis TaxID=402171 RepID=A0A542E5Z8_9MICO|nr:putative RDD family membrane protein YckC [Lapillicoccus jejuensis]
MVDRRDVGSWLDGPRARTSTGPDDYAGARLGLPREGPGSLGRFGRRLVALLVDWAMCLLVASLVLGFRYGDGDGSDGLRPLLVLLVENVVLLATLGSTFGQRLVGLQLRRLDGGRPGLLPVVVRSVLLCIAVPALVWDRDGRGLHDKAAGTMLLRTGGRASAPDGADGADGGGR